MDINIVEGDGLSASQAAGAVQRMTDPRGTEHNVILTIPPGQPSATRKAVWESNTTYKFTQHYLRPETMVRQEQGQEIWAAYRGRCPFRGPVTFDEFTKMVQQRGSASCGHWSRGALVLWCFVFVVTESSTGPIK